MGDLTNPRAIKLKGILFLFLGLLTFTLLLIENHSARHITFLLLLIWSFCRFYYFAFYVIEHYVDPSFRFAGLWDFLLYSLGRGRAASLAPKPPLSSRSGVSAPPPG